MAGHDTGLPRSAARSDRAAAPEPDVRATAVARWIWWAVLALAFGAALWLRLDGLAVKSLSHPEIYVPGIPLPPGLSEPPPRLGLFDTLWFHFHDEPHPMGWYLMMFGWTQVAGTSEWALRLPSVLFGAASVPVIFLLARRVFGTPAAVLAMLLLALHGFHIHWSQAARMYVSGAFWGMLSTWLLLELARARGPKPWAEAGYVLASVAGLQTTELCLPLLFVQIVWAGLFLPSGGLSRPRAWLALRPVPVPRVLQIQSLALMLSAPGLAQALYRARKEAAGEPALSFLQEYAAFGFLYAHEPFASPEFRLAAPVALALAAGAVVLIARGLMAGEGRAATILPPSAGSLPRWLGPAVAVTMAILVAWLASIAHRRNAYLAGVAMLPLAALAMPRIALAARSALNLAAPAADRWLRRRDAQVAMLALAAIALPLALFLASLRASVLAERAFLVLVPYLRFLPRPGLSAAGGPPRLTHSPPLG